MKGRLLLSPCKIGNLEIKNRIVMAPITPNLAMKDGSVTSDLVRFYEDRAKGGAGLIITGWSFIGDEESRDIGAQIGINENRLISGLNYFTETIHQWGAKIFIQLAYIGRKINNKNNSNNAGYTLQDLLGSNYELYRPEDLSIKELQHISKLYGKAALRAKTAGFDGVEIPMSLGEYVYYFLLKKLNKRNDIYGGDFNSRIHFLIEILESIQNHVGKEFPVGFRIAGFDDPHYVNNNFIDRTEIEKFVKIFEDKGIHYINIFRSMLPVYVRQRVFSTSKIVKGAVKIPVMVAGSIIEPEQGEKIIIDNTADFIALGRELLADPDWPNKLYKNRNNDITKCIRCNECLLRVSELKILRCTVNINTGLEGRQGRKSIPETKKRIAVIGGGPAGIKASVIASKRGHHVTLFEKRDILGGNLIPASEPAFKDDFKNLLNQLREELCRSSVNLILNQEIFELDSEMKEFDTVILATGGVPKKLEVPVEDMKNIYFHYDAICNPIKIKGKNIVVIGGGLIGCEAALFLKSIGKNTRIIEIEEDILLKEKEFFKRTELKFMIKNNNINTYNKSLIRKIDKTYVRFLRNNKVFNIPYDSIIIAIGLRPNKISIDNRIPKVNEVYSIGDCKEIGNLFKAIHEGCLIGSIV